MINNEEFASLMHGHAYQLLQDAHQLQASDIFLISGRDVTFKIHGKFHVHLEHRLSPSDTEELIRQIYKMANNRDFEKFEETGDDDFALSLPHLCRFRVNTFRQRNSIAAVIRVISFELPDYQKMHIPETVMNIANENKGLVLVTGSAGSGKSTTLACMIDRINHTREGHIITLEDPLEFLHRHDKCIVSQREIPSDSMSYLSSLRAALRQSPDVILLGEMRDLETISAALTAAETGHLVFSSLHTTGAANTINRILDVFDAQHKSQIATQLALVLRAVVSQQLLPDVNGHPIPAFEIMKVNTAVRNMIRENKIHQLDGVISTSSKGDMLSMDNSILDLYRKGLITKETALTYATNPDSILNRFQSSRRL